MERLTNHFDYCKMIDCKFYDAELRKENKCKFFDLDIEHCHEKRINDKLRKYEDLEEQGLLLRLPCKVGDTVYRINQYAKEPIISMKVLQVRFGELYIRNSFLRIDAINDEDMGEFCYSKNDIGKTVFLTKAEAEKALAEMGEQHGEV